MSKSRTPLTSKQLEILRMINEPKTAQEILFAVNFHGSEANKNLNLMLEQELYLHVLMHKLIKKYAREEMKIDNEKRSQLEKEFVLKEIVIKKMLEQEQQTKEQFAKQNPPKTLGQLILDSIKQAYQVIARIEAFTLVCDAKAAVNTAQWQSLASSQQAQFTQILIDNKVQKIDVAGTEINLASEEAQKILANAFAAPAPTEVVRVLAKSMQESRLADVVVTTGSIPNPPPPPPALPTPKFMAQKSYVNNALRLLSELSGGETGAALLRAKERNEQVFENLGHFLKTEKAVDVRDEINKEIKKLAELAEGETGPALLKALREQKAAAAPKPVTTQSLFADAINIHKRKTQALAELKEAKNALVKVIAQATPDVEKTENKSQSPFNMRPSPFNK